MKSGVEFCHHGLDGEQNAAQFTTRYRLLERFSPFARVRCQHKFNLVGPVRGKVLLFDARMEGRLGHAERVEISLHVGIELLCGRLADFCQPCCGFLHLGLVLLGLAGEFLEVCIQVLEAFEFFLALCGKRDEAGDIGAVLALEFLDGSNARICTVDFGGGKRTRGGKPEQVLADAFERVGA